MLCSYGCGQEAKYKFKNGKHCCSKNQNSCLGLRKKLSLSHKGYTPWNKGKSYEQLLGEEEALLFRKKLSNFWTGKTYDERYGKKSSEIKNKKRTSMRRSIKELKDLFPIFYKVEEMRYNPDKPKEKEIQVHCKYSECENSKEKNGWFTPSINQLHERIKAVEKPRGFGESNFYCSEQCKEKCKLYGFREDDEYSSLGNYIFREEVLKRQRDEYGYNFCEFCYCEKDLHVHHEKPQKINPLFVLDPDNGVVLCKECHYIIGHKTGTECSTGNLANQSC